MSEMKTAREIAENYAYKYTVCQSDLLVEGFEQAILEATAEKDEQLKKAVEALELISEMDGDKGAYHYTLARETLKEIGVE